MTQTNKISIHAPKAQRPQTSHQFGYFLAGLIDANGSIAPHGTVSITFHEKDVSVAYYIKKMVGYGKVKHVKTSKINRYPIYQYHCAHLSGIKVIGEYIRDKLRFPDTIEQFNNHLVPVVALDLDCTPTTDKYNLDNHWLAGVIQGQIFNNVFQIQILNVNTVLRLTSEQKEKPLQQLENIQMTVQIDHKTDVILKLIKKAIGGHGHISHVLGLNTYRYNSVSLVNTILFIKYLDRYQVMGACLTAYWLWRKAYLRVQSGAYQTEKGLAEIAGFKTRIYKLRSN